MNWQKTNTWLKAVKIAIDTDVRCKISGISRFVSCSSAPEKGSLYAKGGKLVNPKKIGAFLKQLRNKKGITQERLAEILGVSGRTVSRWETGEGYPDITLLAPLAHALGTTTDELLKEASKKNTSDDEKAPRETIKEKHRMRPIAFWKHLFHFALFCAQLFPKQAEWSQHWAFCWV